MIPELGSFCIVLALLLAVVQALFGLVGPQRGRTRWTAGVRPVARAQAWFVMLAFAALTVCFYRNDFSVLYVAQNAHSTLPWVYRLAAVWGGHEGSLLLWATILGMWTLAVSFLSQGLPAEMRARVLGVMGLISIGFLSFLLFTSNPFVRMLPAPVEGADLNALLQDPGMASHPPMLYMGYVGFSVAFAFAIAALLSGRLDTAWARWTRPWTTAAWAFLTLGIMLGSWWAYRELGWGGWWFWDPVENASFMPWLTGLALMHSLAVTEKRGAFRSWTVLLAIITFSLSLIGTFLVRSGVLSSVHAFAVDPARGVFILAFLLVVVGGSLVLYAWRASKVGLGGRFELVSREAMLLVNNVVFLVAAGAVLLGTLYPLALDALGLGRITVGAPYFDTVFAPVVAPALFLMGLAPIARWKQDRVPALAQQLKWAFAIAVVSALAVPVLVGAFSLLAALGILAATWIVAATLTGLAQRLRRQGWRHPRLPRAYVGMLMAHIGVAVFVAGVTLVKGYAAETQVRLAPGQATELAGYTVRFEGTVPVNGPNYRGRLGTFSVLRDGQKLGILESGKRFYAVSDTTTTEAAISYGLTGDLYVALGNALGADTWTVRIYNKPFVEWIWLGCLIMALGGFTALSDRRYRVRVRSRKPRRSNPVPRPTRLEPQRGS